MGRRRRRVVRIVKKKLPTVFVCPRCGEEAVRVTIAKDTGKATVMCALCQLKDEFQAHPAAQMIDVYSFFADRFYGVKDPRAIIPHDRESKFAPPEEPSEPESVESEPMQPEGIMEQLEPETVSSAENPETPNPPGEIQAETPASETLSEQSASSEEAASPEEKEEEEPFADILGNKDKKRYSANPIPEQKSEQTSQA